jgi:hypothetical protein
MNKIRHFRNNYEHDRWTENNCDRCEKYPNPDNICPIEDALFQAYWGDLTVSPDIWKRMGEKTGTCSELVLRPEE